MNVERIIWRSFYSNLPKIVEALAESAPKDRPRIRTDAMPSDRAGGERLQEAAWQVHQEVNSKHTSAD